MPEPSASAVATKPLIDAVEGAEFLDGAAKPYGKKIRSLFKPGPVRDALAGTWLGHSLHPLMTDVVVGSWVSANLLDLLGGDDNGKAQSRLIGVGLAAYGPTAASGAMDWADGEAVDPRIRRLGIVHAATNATAFTLYAASVVARRRGSHGRGKALAAAGAATVGFGGFLGGHLSFARGSGVNQTAFDEGVDDWTDAIGSDELTAGDPKAVVVGDTPVMIVRHDDGIHAIHDRCSHRGCSLTSMGEVEGEIVTCNCHGSQFDLRDGSIQRGPAQTHQPVYDVRETDGRIELRLNAD